MLSPQEYEAKYETERASQIALFMWSNMAANFGIPIADDSRSYSCKGYAQNQLKLIKSDHSSKIEWLPIPQLKYLFAIHNQGNASAIQGHRAVEEGLKRGVPDIMLPVSQPLVTSKGYPVGGYDGMAKAGLYIELKRQKSLTEPKRRAGVASSEQLDWQTFLRSQGYVCEICYGFEQARDLICRYLKEGGLI